MDSVAQEPQMYLDMARSNAMTPAQYVPEAEQYRVWTYWTSGRGNDFKMFDAQAFERRFAAIPKSANEVIREVIEGIDEEADPLKDLRTEQIARITRMLMKEAGDSEELRDMAEYFIGSLKMAIFSANKSTDFTNSMKEMNTAIAGIRQYKEIL